ncbi:MAG: glycine-rich domain-containing protein, partial [Candidatus Nanopelagicaceae bacterium]
MSESGAATVTASGPHANPTVCNQSVGNATSVSAYRLSTGECIIEFRNVGTTTWTVPNNATSVRFLIVGGGAAGYPDSGGGGGGGGALTKSSHPVTSGTVFGVTVGAGGSGNNGSGVTINPGVASTLDQSNDGSIEWSASGGSVGTGWSVGQEGGYGGAPSATNGATALTGGRGGQGPNSTGVKLAGTTDGSTGYSSDITGRTLFYGGGGGGGINGSGDTTAFSATPRAGGKGGGGAGAGAGTRGSTYTFTYDAGDTTTVFTQTRTYICETNLISTGASVGFDGLNGFGGGGGGGVAFGDVCGNDSDSTYPAYNDGERTAGGSGGSGIVILNYVPDTTAPTYSSSAVASTGTSLTLTYNETLSSTTAAASRFTVSRSFTGLGSETITVSSVTA